MKNFLHNGRQALLVTIVLLLICGLLFPLLLTGLSKVFFPSQAAGSLVTVDGQVVGAKNVGQEFTEDYYLWGRPSAYHYNTYVEQEDGTQTYNDGSEFAGLSSGSNNYAPSNPALTERVEADLETFLEKPFPPICSRLPAPAWTLISLRILRKSRFPGLWRPLV